MKVKKVLVAGSQGQVGSELIRQGSTYNFEMLGSDRHMLDITAINSVRQMVEKVKPCLIINAAAYTNVEKAEIEYRNATDINVEGARNLAKICCANDIPIFHISTDYVFDGKKQHPYAESDNTAPLNVYGRTKEAGEIAIRRVTKKHIILRTSWVFSSSKSSFVSKILNMALEGRSLTVVADQIGGPTSANSVAATLLDLVSNYHKYDESHWGTYHFSQYPFMSRYDFAIEILDTAVRQGVLSKRPTVTPTNSSKFHTAASRPANSRLLSEKIRAVFGVQSNEWKDDLESAIKVLSNN